MKRGGPGKGGGQDPLTPPSGHAYASQGRRSKLQALVFDPQYIQVKPKGAGVTLYFTPEVHEEESEAKPSQ